MRSADLFPLLASACGEASRLSHMHFSLCCRCADMSGADPSSGVLVIQARRRGGERPIPCHNYAAAPV
jgi:hypothetical protein